MPSLTALLKDQLHPRGPDGYVTVKVLGFSGLKAGKQRLGCFVFQAIRPGGNGQGAWLFRQGRQRSGVLSSSGRGDNGQGSRYSCLWGRVEDFENNKGDKDDKEEEEENAAAAATAEPASVPNTEEPIAGIYLSPGPYFPNNTRVKGKKEKKTAWLT